MDSMNLAIREGRKDAIALIIRSVRAQQEDIDLEVKALLTKAETGLKGGEDAILKIVKTRVTATELAEFAVKLEETLATLRTQ